MTDRAPYRPLRQRISPSVAQIRPLPDSAGWAGVQTMLSSTLLFGLPAWLLGRWLGADWLVGIGLVIGMAVALTVLWFRYGTSRREDAGVESPGSRTESNLSQDTTEGRG